MQSREKAKLTSGPGPMSDEQGRSGLIHDKRCKQTAHRMRNEQLTIVNSPPSRYPAACAPISFICSVCTSTEEFAVVVRACLFAHVHPTARFPGCLSNSPH